jgi:hypothetical protein
VEFSCPEVNYIHPTNQAFRYSLKTDRFVDNGIVDLTTQEFEATNTERQRFIVDGKEVEIHFEIAQAHSNKVNEPPLKFESSLVFEFEPIEDYNFIMRLFGIAKRFICFLCYRKNIYIPTIELSSPYEDGKQISSATMYLFGQDGEAEFDALKEGRYIKQVHIAGHEGEILSDIASNSIYLRHLPETYRSGRHFDAARFVMITAAFEWEFRRQYPKGVEKTKKTQDAENVVMGEIQRLIDRASGKEKQRYKFLKGLVKSDSLQSEIIRVGKDFSGIVNVFGNHLYLLNDQELKYSDMGKRLSDQRNHFAHGDLDKDFIGLALLDLIYMEYVIYAMQLKKYSVGDKDIQKAINELFHCCIAI